MKTKDRRNLKLRSKTDERGIQFLVVNTEFAIDRKRANEVGGGIFYEGYAAIFNTPDAYKDIIKPGAFKKTLKAKGPREDKKTGIISSGIVALWQHNPDWPFGLPVHMEEDTKGLFHRTQVSATRENEDRLTYMEDGIVTGESIGFVTVKADFDEEDDEDWWPTRFIEELDLWEHSPVTFPAHSDAVTELVKRNREIALAVKAADHGRVIEFAKKMDGITLPAVEEGLMLFTKMADYLRKDAEGEGEPEGEIEGETEIEEEGDAEEGTEGKGSGDSLDDAELEEGIGEGEEPTVSTESDPDPITDGDTSEEDPEFIKALEAAVFTAHAKRTTQRIKTRRVTRSV